MTDEAEWLLNLLWSAWPAVAWAPKGSLPPGYRRVESLLLMPSGAGKTFSVSLASRRGASGCVSAYGRLRPPRRRLERGMVGVGLLTGLVQLSGTVVEVGVSSDAGEAQECLLSTHLAQVFGVQRVVVGCGAGTGPYRKPVLQVFDPRGRPLGYVKVGWNSWTREAVGREATALERANAAEGTAPLGVPALLSRHEWNGLDLVVTSPLPRRVRRVSEGAPLPPVEVLARIAGLVPEHLGPLAGSAWWRDISTRVERLPDNSARSVLIGVLEATETVAGQGVLRFAMSHGDFSPWNLGTAGRTTYVWDFEASRLQAPIGLDALHFYFQSEFVAHQRSVVEAVASARARSSSALRDLGVPGELHDLLSHLHLLDLVIRHEEARACTGARDERFAGEGLRALVDWTERSNLSVPTVRRSA